LISKIVYQSINNELSVIYGELMKLIRVHTRDYLLLYRNYQNFKLSTDEILYFTTSLFSSTIYFLFLGIYNIVDCILRSIKTRKC